MYNNAPNETTGTSPFFTNKGYHPTIEVHPECDMASSRAQEFAVDFGELHDTLKANIQDAQTSYQKYADGWRMPYTLHLPQFMHTVHPVYHVSMLDTAPSSNIPNLTEDPLRSMEIEGEVEYKIAEILDTKLDQRRHCKLLYLMRWTGYEDTDEETSWLTANELMHMQELVDNFHKSYPDKPGLHPP